MGIVGGGQLGQMLGLAAIPLGARVRFLDPGPDPPAGAVGGVISRGYTDGHATRQLVRESDVVTYELEGIDADLLARVAAEENVPVYPPPRAAATTQDRVYERRLADRLGIPVAPWRQVETLIDLEGAVSELGLPGILKRRRGGYDGRGQTRLVRISDLQTGWELLGATGCVLERVIEFDREVSLVAVVSRSGELRSYPLVENRHRDGILRLTLAPAPALRRELQTQAEDILGSVASHFGYVGVIALEFFESAGRLVLNEIAPRVHNSGHWTIEGAGASQFENHMRAVLGLPLGDTGALGYFAMVNLIGDLPDEQKLLAHGGVSLHLYGKAPRPARKLGHCTLRASSPADLSELLRESGLLDIANR